MKPVLLNVGCGNTFHRAWLNLDLIAGSPEVVACDLRRGIPLPDGHCEAVYHSHVLEHLPPAEGAAMLAECYRVTRPGGIVRVVVPDLERIARDYLVALDAAAAGREDFTHRWMHIEMYDQCVRSASGGRMAEAIRSASASEYEIIAGRLGAEAVAIRMARPEGRANRTLARWLHGAMRRFRILALEAAVRVIGGQSAVAAMREGLFRQKGEVHICMYDRVLLAGALVQAGYVNPRQRTASDSNIAGFADFQLECAGGKERKPDSLYMEARRPNI
jgi:predicted SAM-dependent methyltransferase